MANVSQSARLSMQRVGAYAVCISRDGARILLSRYTWPDGRWVLPGGGVEHGEAPEVAAMRETLEETGYTTEIVRLLGIESDVWEGADGTSVHSVNILYVCKVTSGALAYEIGGSSDMASWLPLAHIADTAHTVIVDQAIQRLNQA